MGKREQRAGHDKASVETAGNKRNCRRRSTLRVSQKGAVQPDTGGPSMSFVTSGNAYTAARYLVQ